MRIEKYKSAVRLKITNDGYKMKNQHLLMIEISRKDRKEAKSAKDSI